MDVIDAIDTINEDETYFYSIQDEEIVYVLEDDEDDEFFIPLPTKEEVNDYQNMVNFTETIEDNKKRDWFENAIRGKGAFRRFRATLERFGMETAWYDFLEASHRELAIEWCEQHGIVYDTSAQSEEVDDDWDEEDVVKDKRRSGVARKLISEIQKEEVQPLHFEVPTNNPNMHAFLQAIGYAKILHTTYTK